ncbi:DUF5685 family protein [Plantactinospora alkalitolerans]|uniref:DUF5685 family protein n=1 Tax=Plantactinospora alkalitolerans TaxID=2789879 RepID=UPI002B214C0A|nr:DUF5685 family protein [Plantactinospora alkalitolerans]
MRPCRHRMCANLHAAWLGHLCGLCLTLRDEHGHRARLTINYDGLLISVLLAAQSATPTRYRQAGPCALRGFQGASVLSPTDPGARLAAAVSLVLAAGKTRDHVADRDGALRVAAFAGVAGKLADRWAAAGARTGDAIGFDTGVLLDAVARQTTLEHAIRPGASVLLATEPTESAVAAAFAHTATLAGMPGNASGLAEIGRYFGRIAHLLDAVEDYADDQARSVFNPLRATGTELAEARRLCEDAHHGLRLALADVELRDRTLARALLVREVGDAIDRTFTLAHHPSPGGHRSGPSAPARLRTPVEPVGSPYPHGEPVRSPYPHGEPVRHSGRRSGTERHPGGPRPDGCDAPLLIGGACALTACTCGLWQPRWSRIRREKCSSRCWCTRCCDCPDCSACDWCSCDCCGCDC